MRSPISPFDALPSQWVLSRQTVQKNLIIEHQSQTPSAIEVSGGLTHHILVFQLNNNPRRINRLDNREYDGSIRRGELLIIPESVPAFGCWEETTDEIVRLIVAPSFLRQMAAETDCLNPDRVELLPILKTYDPQFQAIALSFLAELYQDSLGTQLYTESLTDILAIHLLRHYCTFKPRLPQYEDGLAPKKLQQAIDFIHANLEQKLSLETIANQLNLSSYYFCQLFAQSMGMPPYAYVLQQRVERAKQLLKGTDLAIAEIAVMCGFSSQAHLTRHFRKFAQTTPKVYRQS